jgi:putative Mg2+ transporter-C (MgtC) family protein
MPSELELAGRIAFALVLGGLIGLERELTDQVAGLRTHISVALGAALFGIVSAYSFGEFIAPRAETNYQVDVTRVASNVVTGVGFLGGGAIIKQGVTVRGLTTAASMWVTAAVGLAAGLGGYFVASVTSAALLVSLVGLRRPRRWLRARRPQTRQTVILHLGPQADRSEVVAALQDLEEVEVTSVIVRALGDGATVQAELRGADVLARLAELSRVDGVTGFEVD